MDSGVQRGRRRRPSTSGRPRRGRSLSSSRNRTSLVCAPVPSGGGASGPRAASAMDERPRPVGPRVSRAGDPGVENVRGYRGIGKIVVPALIVFVMVMGAFGALIGPRGSPETTGGQTTTPSTRAGSIPSALSGPGTGAGGDSDSGVSGDSVSTGMAVNKDIVGRTDTRPEPLAMQYDPASGRAWDQNRQVLTLPDAAIPKNRAVSFTSSVAPTSKVLRSDPAPTAASVDAGGPYGGPGTYEGGTIVFTATVDDPNLMFFRWDFNGDGKWDTGDAASGNWVPDTTVPHQYLNMYSGLATVEAWDGVSTKTVQYTGWALDQPSSPQW